MKKSKASSVQLKKAAATALRARERDAAFAPDMVISPGLSARAADKPNTAVLEIEAAGTQGSHEKKARRAC
jgi:hypothetical protein